VSEEYKYKCPKCEDTGKIPMYKLEYAHVGGDLATKMTDCDKCNGEE
jgi:C4-type Zn-finger protein